MANDVHKIKLLLLWDRGKRRSISRVYQTDKSRAAQKTQRMEVFKIKQNGRLLRSLQ